MPKRILGRVYVTTVKLLWLLLNYNFRCTWFAMRIIPMLLCNAQQKFRIVPRDLQVLEGTEALLRCEIYNLVGAVQWTKDGFALGFSHTIPGYPRYSVLADRNLGIYNLRISNASIEDDAEYQCQVGPAKFNSAIRANARLTVISLAECGLVVIPVNNNAK
uniref:Ig-like domain-containing protein n=1 Tax=Anopheles coluzzii TaxID=1518534 RepID=A0A8W7P9Y2_ANOCL